MTRFNFRAVPLLLSVLALSCGKSTVTVAPIAPGAQCPNGGTSISIDNGTPQIICNGSNGTNGTNGVDGGNGTSGTNGSSGFTLLVKTTLLPIGDAHCASGGQQIDSGLDNGANGGTANDGTLQAGEITSTNYVCNSGGEIVGSIAPPEGAAGNSTITAVGGSADAGLGGMSSGVYFQMWNGSLGGHVKIFKTGAADPSFTLPAAPAFDPGSTPVEISADTTVGALDTSNTDAGAGTLYLDDNGNLAVLDDQADGGSTEATSLKISAGATLTIVPADAKSTTMVVNGSIFNSGTIALASVGATTTLVVQSGGGYFGDSTSQILNNGTDGVLTNGKGERNSGSVADGTNSGGIELDASPIWNQGLLSANGGSGRNGGLGGKISLQAQEHGRGTGSLFNTGIVQSNGGAGTDGSGGNAGGIMFTAPLDVNNSGPLSAVGGSGTTTGGTGGQIGLHSGDAPNGAGSIHNSGTINGSGGSVDSTCVYGDGAICAAGAGGQVTLAGNDGALVNNAAITSRGGSSVNGKAAYGGAINIEIQSRNSSVVSGSQSLVPAGDLLLSGSIDTSGGDGATGGGNAGQVQVAVDPNLQPNGQEIILYGYSRIDASGGFGSTGGGDAGEIQLENTYYSSNGCNQCKVLGQPVTYGPGGSVINDVDLVARGGASGAGAGGSGGLVQLTTQSSFYFSGDAFEQVRNSGSVDASGGDGTRGGPGGSFSFYGLTGVTNSGALTARGGAGLGINGGSASSSNLNSDNGAVTSAGAIDLRGGDGVASAGSSNELDLLGTSVTVSGPIVANGGASSGDGSQGGSGGSLYITSSAGTSSITVTAPAGLSVSGGAAPQSGTSGAEGLVTVDGWNLTSSWTH